MKKLLRVQGFIAQKPIIKIIIGANLSAYLSIKDYGNAILEANKQLTKLGKPIPEWLISNYLLKGLGRAYNNWVDMVLAEYNTNPMGADNKIVGIGATSPRVIHYEMHNPTKCINIIFFNQTQRFLLHNNHKGYKYKN